MFLPGLSEAYPDGIGGEQSNAGETIDDVAKQGCLCHGEEPSNSVMVILVDVPYTWVAEQSYTMRLEIVGGPDTDMGGFSARVSAGELSGDGQSWEDDSMTRTHTSSSSRISRSHGHRLNRARVKSTSGLVAMQSMEPTDPLVIIGTNWYSI